VRTSLLRVRRNTGYEISLTLVDNPSIQKLNKEFRNLDRPTDVLSFALEEGTALAMPQNSVPMLGEIVISAEKALAQAEEYGHSFQREMAFLTVHGMLHLLGYDHQTPAQRKEMEGLQRQILAVLGINR
jgi:probable rRNA maturation factor